MEAQTKKRLQRDPFLFASFQSVGFLEKSFVVCSKPHEIT